jgi:transposase-like protein
MAARRRSRQEWKQIVLEWQRSGLRKAQFTRRHGLNPTTFGFWCWTLKADLAAAPAAPPSLQLLPVQMVPVTGGKAAAPRPQRAIVDLTGGTLRVEFSLDADPRGVADLVAALRERGC